MIRTIRFRLACFLATYGWTRALGRAVWPASRLPRRRVFSSGDHCRKLFGLFQAGPQVLLFANESQDVCSIRLADELRCDRQQDGSWLICDESGTRVHLLPGDEIESVRFSLELFNDLAIA